MRFWVHQQDARRRTVRLVMVYALLVIGFSAAVAVAVETSFGNELHLAARSGPAWLQEPGWRMAAMGLAVPLVLALLAQFSPASSAQGGISVAMALGASRVYANTPDPDERRLLNVVEEMAIASGMPVPPVYLLEHEPGINAFAAGSTINDAVVGVTRGAIDLLDRDELQAVMAHEFSHILNGDMRLNLQFVKLVFAFTCLAAAGRGIMRTLGRTRSRSNKNEGKGMILFLAIALACWLAGVLMALFGRAFQAAVNRQREYLADASSVQFTRTPAMASALKKIGGLEHGSKLAATAMAENYSHFFFGPVASGLFSTHPPLASRIRGIEPGWDGFFPAMTSTVILAQGESTAGRSTAAGLAGNALPSAGRADQPGEAWSRLLSSPSAAAAARPMPVDKMPGTRREIVEAACREPLDASALVLAMLLDSKQSIRARQLKCCPDDAFRRSVLHLNAALRGFAADSLVHLLEKAVPALKSLSPEQFRNLHATMAGFINADGVFSFKEWIIHQLVVSQADPKYTVRRVSNKGDLRRAAVSLLSGLARLSKSSQAARQAFAAGLQDMGMPAAEMPETQTSRLLSASVAVLSGGPTAFRDQFMRAAMAVVLHDGVVDEQEKLFVHMLSLCLGKPVPPMG